MSAFATALIPFFLFMFVTRAEATSPLDQETSEIAGKLNRMEGKISARVNTLSAQIDSFFSREDIETEETGTRVRMGYAARFQEFEDPTYNFILTAKLVLPQTKEKIQVLLLSDEDDTNVRNETGGVTPDTEAGQAVERQKFRLGLRNLFHQSKTSSIALDAGVKIRDPLDPFTRFSARRSIFFESSEIHLYNKQHWFESEGWGTSLKADWDKPLAPKWLFRFSNIGELDHESGLWETNNFLGLYQRYSERLALGYLAGITGNDEPTLALQTYYVAVSSRYALVDDWLYLQITPELSWPRERDWQRVTSLLLKIESIFGGI